jgi:hypothetical protein
MMLPFFVNQRDLRFSEVASKRVRLQCRESRTTVAAEPVLSLNEVFLGVAFVFGGMSGQFFVAIIVELVLSGHLWSPVTQRAP